MTDSFTGSCAGGVDVIFQRGSGTTTRGQYVCTRTANGRCTRATVFLNPGLLGNDLNRRKTACHEIGHSVGLRHADDAPDCMISGAITAGHQTYSAHHVAHVNANH